MVIPRSEPREIQIGRILRPHGIRGEVIIARYGDAPGLLEVGSVLQARQGGADFQLRITRSQSYKGSWLIAFQGIKTRNEAEALQGAAIILPRDRLPRLEEGRYYQFEILGLSVVTRDGETLGSVREILETGANDVYVVDGPRGEVLIPVIEQFVDRIDPEAGTIVVNPPPGLLPEAS